MNIAILSRFIAHRAQSGQTRRDGVTPYFTHLTRVAEALRKAGHSETIQAVAYLHDVLENTSVTADHLDELGVTEEVISAVQAMTKGVSEPYPDYIKRVCENDIARIVKIFDIRDNLADAPTEKQRENYKFAVEMLENKS